MKDYSNWKINLDFENESPFVNPNRPWLKFREKDVPKSIKFDPIPIHEFIKLIANKYPNNVCVYHKPTDKAYTYHDLIYYSDKVNWNAIRFVFFPTDIIFVPSFRLKVICSSNK